MKALLKGEVALECQTCKRKNQEQHWDETRNHLLISTKDVRQEIERQKTRVDRISDAITGFCGHIYFVYVHIAWFVGWLVYNTLAAKPFDPYPYGMLTLIVSLEAIILATFILMSQNRQGEISDLRSQLDYYTDLKSEKHAAEILTLLKKIYAETHKVE
ncbi:MAG: DUF1003 domain-containing protein [Patescibacteria group bacterium]